MAKQRHPNKLLAKRLAVIERLFERQEISEKDYDILDTSARLEGGMLTYEEIFGTVVEGYIPPID